MNREIWNFAKQNIHFDNSVKVAHMLFDAKKNGEKYTSQFYNTNRSKYGLSVDERVFSTAQLLGLITKTNFYKSRNRSIEKTTDVYDLLKLYETKKFEYNTIKTEHY